MLKAFPQYYKVHLCTRSLRWKHDNSLVLKQNLIDAFLTFNDLIEGRIAKLLKCHFFLLHVRLLNNEPIFRFRSPAPHSKDWTCLAELWEDQITIFVETLELLAKAPSKGKAINADLKHENIIASLH